MIFLVSCVLVHRSLCSILHGIRALVGHGTSSNIDSYLDPLFFNKITPSSTAPEVENLPLNIPS